MDDPSESTTRIAGGAPTIDMQPAAGDTHPTIEPAAPLDGYCRVAVVEGSQPQLTSEIACLLRRRLRLAAITLFAGFAVFLIKHVFQADFSTGSGIALFVFQAVVTVSLGIPALLLCRRCSFEMRWLRVAELVIFGMPVLFFLYYHHLVMLRAAEKGFFLFPLGAWLVLIYTYALFIPNTLRRAALVIGLIAAAPMVLLALMIWQHPELAAVVSADDLTSFPLMLILASVGSVFGVDTIGTLQREAFEARQLGQYRLTKRLGAGGMGEVYLAEHQLLKRACAIKLIRPGKAADPRVLARFQREVRSTARLTHWNTIDVYDYGQTEDGTFYYAMEYLPGMSLAEIVDRYGPMPPQRVVHLLRQTCDALSEAHAAGLVHRDIKPANIFAARRGGIDDVAKLLDFGLVKPIVDETPLDLTVDGSITGTPWFMSPEQATGDQEPDARSDIYSLGAVAYYTLTGRPPFSAERAIKVLIAHVHEEAVPPSQHNPDVPADLERVVLRCLAKAPGDRYQTAAELAAALDACESSGGWTRQKAAEWWSSRPAAAPA